MKKLNIGCGFSKIEGYWNIDKMSDCNPDQVVDLEKPWPFQDNSISEILASHVLEHLGQETDQFLLIMKEMYRVCQDGAKIMIQVPHHNHWTFHSDPTHVRKILPETFLLFDQKENRFHVENGHANTPLGLYCKVDFQLVKAVPYYDEPWATRIKNQTITSYDLQFAAAHYTNVIFQWDIELRVRKNGA
jgi:hypothetical protein